MRSLILPTVVVESRTLLRFFEPYPAPTTDSIVAGVLRLSTKYEVEYLRRRALVHLSSQFPTTLADWDVMIDKSSPLWLRSSWEYDPESSVTISLIVLSRETRAPWILPIAFYLLGSDLDDPGAILYGVPSLDHLDQVSFFKGYFLQRDASRTVTAFLYDPPTIDGCTSRKRCAEGKLAALRNVGRDCDRYPGIPFVIWSEPDWETRLSDLCATCLRELRKAHQEAREDLWARLPDMYGLPPWEELEKLKEAAINAV